MLNPSNLTQRKKDIYLYLQQCIAAKGYPPSVREIGEAVGLRSSSTVHRYLAELENDGFIICHFLIVRNINYMVFFKYLWYDIYENKLIFCNIFFIIRRIL